MQQLIPFLLLAVLWVALLLPQRRRAAARKALDASLEVGDEVITTAGFYGEIRELAEDVAVLALSPGVEVRVARGAIAKRLESSPAADD